MASAALKHAWLLMLSLFLSMLCANGQEEDVVTDQDIEEEAMTKEQLRSLHAKFDADSNGKVSLQEVMAFAEKMSKAIAGKDVAAILEEIDTDKDGKLSLQEHLNDIHNQADGGDAEEMKELEKKKESETNKFKSADSDGDGVLGPQEVPGLFYPETHAGVLNVAVHETMRAKDHDGDGMLTPKEFWEFGAEDSEQDQLSDEEIKDFKRLDQDGSQTLDESELKAWESGIFHTEAAMVKLLEICDKDGDMQCNLEELENAREELAASDAQYHLIEWAEHNEL